MTTDRCHWQQQLIFSQFVLSIAVVSWATEKWRRIRHIGESSLGRRSVARGPGNSYEWRFTDTEAQVVLEGLFLWGALRILCTTKGSITFAKSADRWHTFSQLGIINLPCVITSAGSILAAQLRDAKWAGIRTSWTKILTQNNGTCEGQNSKNQ